MLGSPLPCSVSARCCRRRAWSSNAAPRRPRSGRWSAGCVAASSYDRRRPVPTTAAPGTALLAPPRRPGRHRAAGEPDRAPQPGAAQDRGRLGVRPAPAAGVARRRPARGGDALPRHAVGGRDRHAQRISLSYHDSKGSADSLYRINQDAAVIDKIMVEGIIPFVAAGITLAMMIVVMTRLDWQLALVALGVSPPLVVLSRLYRPRMRRQSRHVKKLESSALAVVQETLGALRV